MRQTSLLPGPWIQVKDGNDTGRAIFDQHYSRYHYADGRKPLLYAGPGEKLVLVSPDAQALFIWRRFRSMDDQTGVNCAVFRNEGTGVSSELIRAADSIAWERWPGERHYTYVDPKKVRHKRDPGRCFLKAGWSHVGWTKARGLRILAVEAAHPAESSDTVSRTAPAVSQNSGTVSPNPAMVSRVTARELAQELAWCYEFQRWSYSQFLDGNPMARLGIADSVAEEVLILTEATSPINRSLYKSHFRLGEDDP